MRLFWWLAWLLLACGCATAPARPATVAERTPSPGSISRDNPGGDAVHPADAALSRLLEEPIGTKLDRFQTLKARFPDIGNWRRVRFFGHPTRAGFRYGKDPAYAMGAIEYREAEGDDTPAACLQSFLRRGARLAQTFEIEMGPVHREVGRHYRGPESVDWVEHEKRQKRKRQRRQERLAKRREQRKQRLAVVRARAEQVARRRKQAQNRRIADTFEEWSKRPAPAARADASAPPPAGRDPTPTDGATKSDEQIAETSTALRARRDQLRRLIQLGPKLRAVGRRAPQGATRARRASPRRDRPGPTRQELWDLRWQRHEERYGMATMPALHTWGRFNTLIDNEPYLGAAVAYHSWPGTCLVQGFAVKVGTDETLASKVLRRWIEELAPRLLWVERLREAPPIENR